MIGKIAIAYLLVFTDLPVMAQLGKPVAITALADSMRINPKPILLLISTDWCKYCGMQKALLQKNKDLQSAKDSFYHLELNAETRDSIIFNGKIYHYKNNGATTGIHELAVALGDQKRGVGYPTWVLLDKKYRVLFRHNGVLAPKELKIVLNAIEEINRS